MLVLSASLSGIAGDITRFFDPIIGTGGHGHTFPGATLPFGIVQLSPDTRVEGWDACGGYHYSDSTILGFSHEHLSGTGIADYGDILLVPTDAGTGSESTRFRKDHRFRRRALYKSAGHGDGDLSAMA